jgi:uncharacterized RDD family membrane protein YckC
MGAFSEPWVPEPQVDLPAADRLKRMTAALMDEGLWVGAAGALGLLFSGGTITALGLLVAVVQDAPFGGGTSVGRRVTDQVLVDHQGMECTVARGAARNALRLAIWALGCGLPLLLDLGLALVHPKGRTSADLILGTQVVDREHATPRPDQLEARERRLLEG